MSAKWSVSRRGVLAQGLAGGGGLLAAACSDAGGRGGQEAIRQPASPVTIEVYALANSQPDEVAYKNLLATLKRDAPNVTVSLSASGGLAKLQTAMAAGTPPDIANNIILDLGTIYARNLAIPAAQVLKGSKTWQPDGFLPGLRASHSYKGEMVAVPMVTSAAPLCVSLELLDRAGLKVPTADWTWDTLAEYAAKLTLRSGTTTTQWGYAPFGAGDTLATNEFNTILHSYGGAWIDASGTKAAFTSPEGVAALEWFVDVFRKKQVAPWPFPVEWAAPGAGQLGGRNRGFLLGNNGGTAMTTYELESLVQFERTFPFRWTTVLQPRKRKNAHHQSGFAWFVPRGAPHLDAAAAFLRVAASPESLARWSLDQSRLATHEAAFARPEWQAALKQKPVLQTFWEAAKGGSTYPGIAGWTDARAILATNIGKVINGESVPKEALDDAARQADAIFAQARGA